MVGRRLKKERAPAHTSRRCGRGVVGVGAGRGGGSGLACGGDSGTCGGRGGGVLIVSPPRRVPRRLCSSRCWTAGWLWLPRSSVVWHALCWCARIPSVLGRPALIKTQSDRLVGPLSRKKINHWALAVLLRGSDRCPTHVGSGCELVARVVSSVTLGADWSRRALHVFGRQAEEGTGKGEGLRRGHIWVVHSRVRARARGRVRARVRASGTRHVCGARGGRGAGILIRGRGFVPWATRAGNWVCSGSASRWMCSAVCVGFRDGACGDWCVGRRRSRERVICSGLVKPIL